MGFCQHEASSCREHKNKMARKIAALEKDRVALRAALVELVELKDMKIHHESWLGARPEMINQADQASYLERKPKAWEAARAALLASPPPAVKRTPNDRSDEPPLASPGP